MPRAYTADERHFLLVWVHSWSEAVKLQAERVHSSDDDRMIADSDLFLLSIRNLHRACSVFTDDHRIAAALATFDAEAGAITAARDLLEHFDEYDRGVGHLQRDGRMAEDRLLTHYEGRPGRPGRPSERLIYIGPHVIDVRQSAAAAAELAKAILDIARAG